MYIYLQLKKAKGNKEWIKNSTLFTISLFSATQNSTRAIYIWLHLQWQWHSQWVTLSTWYSSCSSPSCLIVILFLKCMPPSHPKSPWHDLCVKLKANYLSIPPPPAPPPLPPPCSQFVQMLVVHSISQWKLVQEQEEKNRLHESTPCDNCSVFI